MRKTINLTVLAALAATAVTPMAADAQHRRHRYYGRDTRYEQGRCHRENGTTGLVAGGAGGAVLGNVLGGGTLGTVAGGVGGALLGRHIDKRTVRANNRRRGC